MSSGARYDIAAYGMDLGLYNESKGHVCSKFQMLTLSRVGVKAPPCFAVCLAPPIIKILRYDDTPILDLEFLEGLFGRTKLLPAR